MPSRYLLPAENDVIETRSVVAQMSRECFGFDSLSEDDVREDIQNTILRPVHVRGREDNSHGMPEAYLPGQIKLSALPAYNRRTQHLPDKPFRKARKDCTR